MYKLYDFAPSGNCYKLRLAMHQLGFDYQRVPVDITLGESRTEEFLRINPNGRVPVLQTPEGHLLSESNAALWYLASDSPLLPSSTLGRAQALQWMFFEQYSHEPFIATARYWISILKAEEHYKSSLEEKRVSGYAALDVMEHHLSGQRYFVGEAYSVADIALYAYTHVAHEGGFELQRYPAIRTWLGRIEKSQDYVPITE